MKGDGMTLRVKVKERLGKEFDDEIRFFKGWMSNTRAVGSIIPTSSITARRMASVVNPASGLPVLELGLSAYRGWVGIVVYPNEFVVPRRIEDEDGIVHEFDDVLSGEAWEGGPLVISWHDVQLAGQADSAGYNVVIHEFAHKLDMLNGEADGIPALHSGLDEDGWIAVFDAAFEDFCRRVDADEETIIDPYASQDHGEFFAVISEVFFLTPQVVAGDYPELYDLLRRYYRQDPLQRLTKAASADSTAAS